MPIPITTAPTIWFRPARGVDDPAGVHDGHDPADAQPRRLRLPRDLDEVTPERVRRELPPGAAERPGGVAASRDSPQVGAAEHVAERHAPGGAVGLDEHAA